MPCVMPEMPYCPACDFGHIVYPADTESIWDTYGGECEWVCTCTEDDVRRVTDENARGDQGGLSR